VAKSKANPQKSNAQPSSIDNVPRYIFIDFENLHKVKLSDLHHENIRLFIFVGKFQNKIPFEMVTEAQNMGERVDWIKIEGSSRDNLDFHICFFMGLYHKEAHPKVEFIILSKDKGFDPIAAYIASMGRPCRRYERIAQILGTEEKRSKRRVNHELDSTINFALGIIQKLRPAQRPRKVRTLLNYIGNHLRKEKDKAPDMEEILQELVERGHLEVQYGKPVYHIEDKTPAKKKPARKKKS